MFNFLKNTLILISVLFIIGYVAIGILLYAKQRDMLYFAQPYEQTILPSIDINVDEATINILELTSDTVPIKQAGTITTQKSALIYFGGNAEAVINSADIFTPLVNEYDIYLVNYRGYGTSTGQITEKNNYQDAQAVYDYVKKTHSDISVIGRSIGTGVATYLAEQNSVDKLVLITPYDSILNVAQRKFPIFPLKWLLKDQYPSIERAPNISSDTLILSAENDELIPVAHAKRLSQAFKKVDYQEIGNADHNDIMNNNDALQKFWAFLNVSNEDP